MALDKFQSYLFVSAGEQSNKYLTPAITNGIAQFQAQRGQSITGLTVRIDPVQSGTGDPSPTNIRPISGRTGLTVTATGKNLLKWETTSTTINGVTFTVNSDGTVKADGTATADASLYATASTNTWLKAGAYVVNGCPSGGSNTTYMINETYKSVHDTGGGATFTMPDDGYVRVRIVIRNGYTANNLLFKPMIRPASISDDTFVPYTAQTYPISWQTEAGTVYGGTLDVVSGVLTVTDVCITLTSSSTHWKKSTAYPGNFFLPSASVAYDYHVPEIKNGVPFVCSHAKSVTQVQDLAYGCCFMDGSVNICIMQGSDTLEDWLNYLDAQVTAGTPVQICCVLDTPQTYNITPADIKTLAGFNQVYSDAGPVIDIKF